MMKTLTLAPLGRTQTQGPQLSRMHQSHMPWQGTSKPQVHVTTRRTFQKLDSHWLLEQQLCASEVTGMSSMLQFNPQHLRKVIRRSKQPKQLPLRDPLASLSHPQRRTKCWTEMKLYEGSLNRFLHSQTTPSPASQMRIAQVCQIIMILPPGR